MVVAGISEIARSEQGATLELLVMQGENDPAEVVAPCSVTIPYSQTSRRRRKLQEIVQLSYEPHEFKGLTTVFKLEITNMYGKSAGTISYKRPLTDIANPENPLSWQLRDTPQLAPLTYVPDVPTKPPTYVPTAKPGMTKTPSTINVPSTGMPTTGKLAAAVPTDGPMQGAATSSAPCDMVTVLSLSTGDAMAMITGLMSTPSRRPCGDCLMGCTAVAASEAMGCAMSCAGVGAIGIGASTPPPTDRTPEATSPPVPNPVRLPDVATSELSTDAPINIDKTVSPTMEPVTAAPTQPVATSAPEGLGTRLPESQAPIAPEGLNLLTPPPAEDPGCKSSWKCTMSASSRLTTSHVLLVVLLTLATYVRVNGSL
jgi:hypothetical protein